MGWKRVLLGIVLGFVSVFFLTHSQVTYGLFFGIVTAIIFASNRRRDDERKRLQGTY